MLGSDGAAPHLPAHRPPARHSHLGPGAVSMLSVLEGGSCRGAGPWKLHWEAWALSPACDCGSNLRAFAHACRTQELTGPSSETGLDRPSAHWPMCLL